MKSLAAAAAKVRPSLKPRAFIIEEHALAGLWLGASDIAGFAFTP